MTTSWTFDLTPTPPDWQVDWDRIVALSERLRVLHDCPQDPVWHAEGDVGLHTRQVCEALAGDSRWRDLPPPDRSALFLGAVFHDVGKPLRTRQEAGRITSRGHAATGCRMTRELLWHDAAFQGHRPPLDIREEIAWLVRNHGIPLYFFDRSSPQRTVIRASLQCRCDRLALLATADVRGRTCDDQEELLERIALFEGFCRENDCWDGPRSFANDHSRFLYFRKDSANPRYEAYDDSVCRVTLLAGLPASGKDTWADEHARDLPIVSLDGIRAELRVAPQDDQSAVVERGRERAREHLRERRDFVWNATNITRSLRDSLTSLFASYSARIRIVYLEAPLEVLIARNQARDDPVPRGVLEKLVRKLDVPDLTEAHEVIHLATD